MNKFFENLPEHRIMIIYTLFTFVGLTNYFGFISDINLLLSGLLIMITPIYILYETLKQKLSNVDNAIGKSINKYRTNLIYYFTFVIVVSWLVEFVGAKTGLIFGHFTYGDVLQPKIFGVPIAIGFAWISSIIVSIAIMQKYAKINLRIFSSFKKSLIAGILITIFDYFLEMAAIKLGFWSWNIGIVPTQNYLAWFAFGTLFSYIGYKFKLLDTKLPSIAHHLFFAQLLFFVLSSM
jgi:bisanhydrobacterioruberin hydratase